jgi:hypothetical protein
MMQRLFGTLVLLLGASSCYTTANVVTVPRLETDYPVSASSHYVDADDTIVGGADYHALPPFSFEVAVSGARHETTQSVLRLEPQLDRIVANARGDAITDFRIEPIEYNNGSHELAAKLKLLGWQFGIAGAGALSIAALGAAKSDHDMARTGLLIGGGVAGLSALSFVLSALANRPASWRFWVTGRVVKRTHAPLAPPTEAPDPP